MLNFTSTYFFVDLLALMRISLLTDYCIAVNSYVAFFMQNTVKKLIIVIQM